jgi:ferredoxin-type protein NapF
VLVWPLTPWEAGPRAVVETSPLVAICASIINRTIGLTAGVGIAFGLISLFKKRFYCRFICPTGLLLEGISHIGLKKLSWWKRCPPVGQYAAALTLAGALIGYPVLLWMDPMALFSSPFAIAVASDVVSGMLAGILLGILFPMTLMLGGIWCGRLCPLGGFQDQLAAVKPVVSGGLKTVVTWFLSPPRRQGKVTRTRRAILASAIGIGLGFWGRHSGLARAATENAPLRPPGALPETQFAGVCIRCGNCTAACPSNIIHPDVTGAGGFAGLLAPKVRYDEKQKYCLEKCNLCTQVCPSGALQRLDLSTKNRYIIGEALVDANICLLTLGKKECDVCTVACPFKAISIQWDDDQYISYPGIDTGKCNGCGACEVACPTDPVKAISVWSLLTSRGEEGRIVEAKKFLPD